MATICPTITCDNEDIYHEQMDRVSSFANRIHIDLADGIFTPNKLIPISKVWWPDRIIADIHMMYQNVMPHINELIKLKPNMVIVHAESKGEFNRVADLLHANNIKVGVALLPTTNVKQIEPAISLIDHVLIFSGDLGYFGGKADLSLVEKVINLKIIKPTLEIGWDGGINPDNVRKLIDEGVDVLNVGGGIHNQPNPSLAYDKLKALAGK